MYLNCRRNGFKLTLEEASEACDTWADTWPEMHQYFNAKKDGLPVPASIFEGRDKDTEDYEEDDDNVVEEIEITEQETVQLFRGYNNLGMFRVKSTRNAALNFPFQSLAAVVSKRALWLVFRDSLEKGYKLVNFIHEINVDVKESELLGS